MLKTTTLYAIKRKDGKYMQHCERDRARWTQYLDVAWLHWNVDIAKRFADDKGANVVELTIIERVLKTGSAEDTAKKGSEALRC